MNNVRKESAKQIGAYIRKCREDIGLSRSKFAKKINMSIHVIRHYERGNRVPDNVFTLLRILIGLNADKEIISKIFAEYIKIMPNIANMLKIR